MLQLFLKKNQLATFPKVAVVILNWNGLPHLQRFLPSVLASSYPHLDIIVADNASTDESVSWLQSHCPTVRILQAPENLGFAGGYNYFLQKVEADYYVLLNSDVEVTPNWIQPVIALMEKDHTIAACQPKILSVENPEYFEYAGASGGWIDALAYPFSRGRVFDTTEKDEGQYNDCTPVFWASGAAFFVRAKLFHESGGFYAPFFAHQEEIDLCWRLQRMGYCMYVCPSSVVYHLGGGTLTVQSSRKMFLNYRNNLIMAVRNWPLRAWIWKLPLRYALDAVSAWKFLFSGNPSGWLAVLKAHLHFCGWFIRNIRTMGYARKGHAKQGVYNGSVVWDYFIAGKKYFSQIVKKN
jgi:GT2 family glycosyltransferase